MQTHARRETPLQNDVLGSQAPGQALGDMRRIEPANGQAASSAARAGVPDSCKHEPEASDYSSALLVEDGLAHASE